MIDLFDNLLRHLFISQIDEIKDETQVRFEPPDEKWRAYVANMAVKGALNVYLVDLRENRQLRSNERVRRIENGIVNEEPAPQRIDCHYLISAWSPAAFSQAIEPTVDEHALLYKVIVTLMKNEPLVPRKIYGSNPLPANFPQDIADMALPAVVLPVEGFPKLAEFWGTMGNVHPWKPFVYLIVTLPVFLKKVISGPMVTTRITEYRIGGKPETAEIWIEIGGHVITGSPSKPVSGALVELEDAAGTLLQTTMTDPDGRFIFAGLTKGSYRLRVQAQGFPEASRNIEVPSTSGNYDVQI
jgi:hypothetical protein